MAEGVAYKRAPEALTCSGSEDIGILLFWVFFLEIERGGLTPQLRAVPSLRKLTILQHWIKM